MGAQIKQNERVRESMMDILASSQTYQWQNGGDRRCWMCCRVVDGLLDRIGGFLGMLRVVSEALGHLDLCCSHAEYAIKTEAGMIGGESNEEALTTVIMTSSGAGPGC